MLFKSKKDRRNHHKQQDNGYHPWKISRLAEIQNTADLHIATVEMIPYDLTRLLRLSVTMTSITSGGTYIFSCGATLV